MNFKYRAETNKKETYYHLWIAAAKDQVFFQTSLDKAFTISLFQDLLSPRETIKHIRCMTEKCDLIAYSLTDFGMSLLVCGTGSKSIEDFGQELLTKYAEHLQQQETWEILPFDTIFTYDHLADEHEALAISREIHLLHDDWRNDRYSSIGFYLDDRRGDWLCAWRLATIYNNDTVWYQNFLMDDTSSQTMQSLEFIQT